MSLLFSTRPLRLGQYYRIILLVEVWDNNNPFLEPLQLARRPFEISEPIGSLAPSPSKYHLECGYPSNSIFFYVILLNAI